MSEYIKKTIAAYDQSPYKYQASTEGMTPSKEFEHFIELLKGKTVLDAGCAFGRDTAAFSQEGLDVTGIDLSEGLLNKAKELYPTLNFQKMDVRSLDFKDESFDGVWSHATLLHLNDQDLSKALSEINRVLKPEGALFVSFKKGEGSSEVVESFSSDAARFYNFKTFDALEPILDAAGFKGIDGYYINEQELFSDSSKRDLKWLHCFAIKA